MWLYLLVITGVASELACSWQCDDPTCVPHVIPMCKQPNCTIMCDVGNPALCNTPRCRPLCPGDQVPDEDCPACETVCDAPQCPITHTNCTILCEAINCSWKSLKCTPRRPICNVQCEQPACEYVSGASANAVFPLFLFVFLALIK